MCKVRGFSLNYKASLILNFNSMKEALVGWKMNKPKELNNCKNRVTQVKD